MQNFASKRQNARIEADFRDGTKKRVRYASRQKRVTKARLGFKAWIKGIIRGIGRFFGFFRGPSKFCSRNPYVYTGPARAKGGHGRYDVHMRQQGRKYKKARVA